MGAPDAPDAGQACAGGSVMQLPHAYFFMASHAGFHRDWWIARSEPRPHYRDDWFINSPVGFGCTTRNGVTIHLYGAPL